MPTVRDPKGWERPYVRGSFEFRPRPVTPKQAEPGDWERELQRIRATNPQPPVYEPLPTACRWRLKRRAMVMSLHDHNGPVRPYDGRSATKGAE